MEGVCFEFTNLSYVGNMGKNQTGGAHPSAAAFRPCASIQTVATAIVAITPGSRCRSRHRAHCHCSPSSCKPRICAAILASTSSTHFKPEPTAIASGRSTSLAAASSPMSSSSPVAVCAPPAPPPLRGGLHDHVVHLRPHLHCRQLLVRAVVIVHFATDFLIIARPPR
jgi:hypothetical protein